jgi:hypothetical protein
MDEVAKNEADALCDAMAHSLKKHYELNK